MLIPDINILLYAYNEGAPFHHAAKQWLNNALNNRSEPIGLPWQVILGFVRISTNPRIFTPPMGDHEAFAAVRLWMSQEHIDIVHPVPDHLVNLLQYMRHTEGPDRTSDAHIAAIAVENDAIVITHDRDFRRIPGLRWHDPITDESSDIL